MLAAEVTKSIQEYPFLVAGEWQVGEPYPLSCPYDGAPVAIAHRAGPQELERAIEAATRAFEVTRKLPAFKRAEILRSVSEGIKASAEEFAHTLALEAGKPIKQARAEVSRATMTFAVAAEEATRISDEALHLDALPGGEGRPGW